MHVDLLTLYFLAIGTLLASAGMTLWECRTHPQRSKELKILAGGYMTLASGCALAILRRELPGAWGGAISNIVILSGYLLILEGIAVLKGRRYRVVPAVMLLSTVLAWIIAGTAGQAVMWAYVSAIPIAVASALAAREMLRRDGATFAQSGRMVVVVTGIHALFYAVRASLLPYLAASYGSSVLLLSSQITMYEGVLYSVVLPMTLLRLVREEAHGRLLRDAQTDYLTRLGNRRWFFEEGTRRIAAARGDKPISLLVFDLDYFKTINDRYGHKTGDEVLRSFADVAQDVIGTETDAVLARIGGEEFAALLPGYDSIQAKGVGEALAQRFARTISHSSRDIGIQATVSVGLAQLSSDAPNLTDLLALADQALYRAKYLGRNRLELAEPLQEPAVA